jgi:hypothetical protein
MRRSLRGTALLALAGLLWALGTVAAGASELDAHGWWWRAQGVTQLPSPPWVPEGGLAVAQDVEGPSAIAAVRFHLDEDASAATLTLDVANEQGGQTAAIRACPARARWRSVDAGTWEHRPSASCEEGEVAGVRDEDGGSWTFDVGMLLDEGELNVVLLPGGEVEAPDEAPAPGLPTTEGGDGQGPPFQIAFEAPTSESLEAGEGFGDAAEPDLETEPFDPEGGAEGEPQEGAPPDLPESGAPIDPGGDDAQGAAPPVSMPEASGAPEAVDAEAPEVAESDEVDAGDDEPVVMEPPGEADGLTATEEPMAAAPASFGQDRVRQLAMAIAVAAAGAGAMLWWSPQGAGAVPGLRRSLIVRPEVAQASLAGLAGGEPTARGLGRFTRPREGEPPPL